MPGRKPAKKEGNSPYSLKPVAMRSSGLLRRAAKPDFSVPRQALSMHSLGAEGLETQTPIIEDDEQSDDANNPILPSFQSDDKIQGHKMFSPSVSDEDDEGNLRELERDFDQEFDKDIEEDHDGQHFIGIHRQLAGYTTDDANPFPAVDNDSSDVPTEDSGVMSDPNEEGIELHNYNDQVNKTKTQESAGSKRSRKLSIKSVISRVVTSRSHGGGSTHSGHSGTQSGSTSSKKETTSETITSATPPKAEGAFHNLFGRNATGRGMVPNAFENTPKKVEDEESQIGLENVDMYGYEEEAKRLVNGMFPERDRDDRNRYRSVSGTPEEITLTEPVDQFDDVENYSDWDSDVPDAIANKPHRVQRGVASSLFAMHNMGPRQKRRDPYYSESDSDVSSLSGHKGRKKGGMKFRMSTIGASSSSLVGNMHRRVKSALDLSIAPKSKPKPKDPTSPQPEQAANKFSMPQFSKKRENGSVDFTVSPPSSEDDDDEAKKYRDHYKSMKKRKRKNIKDRFHTEDTARVTVHIANVLQRQQFIMTLCKAFMKYGAPTHRLEEYMTLTARVLEIDGSFIYFPGSMIISFGDASTRTSEMRLVRCAEGIDLGKLDDAHEVYKNVVHDRQGAKEGTEALNAIINRKPRFNPWISVLLYGFCSAMVGPWAFGASWKDMPICFGLGAVIGFMQLVICPRNPLYSSLFEVSASILSSFVARAIGSIHGGSIFCYSSMVQSSLALILPGYIILCGSLELQSRNMVAGAVRMFYAFIYSLMLSFGITLGAALYGWIDSSATSSATCTSNISPWFRFLFIPMFTIGIALVNQATWGQLPVMVFISSAGYVVTYFSSKHFKNATSFTAALGCFIIGLVSNIYSRLMKSVSKYLTRSSFMTVSLMLPAIFVQVPSGIASQGSVLIGINSANELVHSNSTTTSVNQPGSLSSMSFGLVMIEVALGISVGLYLATVVVYPLGKKRTGLFTL